MNLDHDLEDDLIDSCDLDMEQEPLAEGEDELFVLFAEALDPDSPVTIRDVEEAWSNNANS